MGHPSPTLCPPPPARGKEDSALRPPWPTDVGHLLCADQTLPTPRGCLPGLGQQAHPVDWGTEFCLLGAGHQMPRLVGEAQQRSPCSLRLRLYCGLEGDPGRAVGHPYPWAQRGQHLPEVTRLCLCLWDRSPGHLLTPTAAGRSQLLSRPMATPTACGPGSQLTSALGLGCSLFGTPSP